jgi:adenylate cyclase
MLPGQQSPDWKMAFFAELKRRNVVRVGAAYVAVSWLLIQVAETTFPAFGFGDAAVRLVIIVASIGFVPVLAFAWTFELTPEGFKHDREVDRSSPAIQRMAQRLDRIVIVLLALALGYFAFDKFVLAPQREATVAEEARQAGRTAAIVESYGEKSIAVLPFTDLSPEANQAYFADGIAEELLNLLSGVRDLRVIARSSSFALRNERLGAPQVAQRLNVSYVLEGSVRKAGDRVRITVQLIEARSDTQLWSQDYESTLDDIFAVQDQISARVVSELKVRMLGAAPSAGVTDTAAYDLYLQGLSKLAGPTKDDAERAVDLFQRVIEIVPDYAPAHASLALALIFLNDDTRVLQESRIEAEANRTLTLDPGNADALVALGRLRWLQRRVGEAREALEQAIARNPSHPLGYRWLGSTYLHVDPVRYLSLVQQAYLIDPGYASIHEQLAYALMRMGRTDEALAVAARHHDSDPTDAAPYWTAGLIHLNTGRQDLALQSYYRAFRAAPENAPYEDMTMRLIDLGELTLAQVWLNDARQRSGARHPAIEAEAILSFENGRPREALQLIEDAVQRNEIPAQALAHWTMRFSRDFNSARQRYEQGYAAKGQDMLNFDPDLLWIWYIDAAFLLQRSGSLEAVTRLIRQIDTHVDAQLAQGVITDGTFHLEFYRALLRAIAGDSEEAVAALRRAVEGGFTCAGWVRVSPEFDGLRNDPAFVALLADVEAKLTTQRRSLASEGMLLTPEQVLEIEDFSFDPLVQSAPTTGR